MNRIAKAGVVVFSAALAAVYVASRTTGQTLPGSKSFRPITSADATSQPTTTPTTEPVYRLMPGSKSGTIFPGSKAAPIFPVEQGTPAGEPTTVPAQNPAPLGTQPQK